MNDYVISCGSTVDLSKEHLEQRNIDCICFHYYIDNVHYDDDLGETMPFKDFYAKLRNGAETRTSQTNIDEFVDRFTKYLDQGKDILHITLSSGISGVINSARTAAEDLKEKYPDRKIYIIDSFGASSGYGLMMDKIADLRDSGMDIDTLYNWINENKLKLHHWFFSTDLSFYVKGGRISKTAGLFGTVLNLCPLLNMDAAGKLIPRQKIRGKNNAITRIVEMMVQHAQGGKDYNEKCYISHSDCFEDAKKVADLVEQNFPNLKGKVLINNIGTTIGSHTGPGTVALFFWGDLRK